jgi:ABC-type transport system involved in multi-copper enzyme maturation permease subunit
MFKTLLIKEWKEKASLAAFGLGLMIVFLAAFLIFGDSQDLRDLIPAGFLIIFFPFIGLILGAGAFESEFRDGAWAYLLSRPVRKETVWLAKLVALLAIMAGFWLAFLGLMAAVPGIGEVVMGFKYPGLIETGLAFFPLILLSSVFYFSVAFSLSILSERQFSLVFGSFFLGFLLQGVLGFFAFQAGGRDLLTHAGRFPLLDAFEMALVLSSLAFLGASLITFRKADFSQPKKKTVMLSRFSIIFLVAAWLLSAAWPSVRPGPKEELYDAGIMISAGDAFFATTRGFYRYDIVRDKIRNVVRWRDQYPHSVVSGGKVLYLTDWYHQDGPALWVVNTDGSERRLLAGGGRNEPGVYSRFSDIILSPDGRTAVYISEEPSETPPRTLRQFLVSIRTDGSGSIKLAPLDLRLGRAAGEYSYVMFRAWLASPARLLLASHSRTGAMGLWTYDLATGAQSRLFESPRPVAIYPSPGGDTLLVITKEDLTGPVVAFLQDLATGTRSPVMTIVPRTSFWSTFQSPVWSRDGSKLTFLVQSNSGDLTPAVYLLPERRVIMPGDIQIKKYGGMGSPRLDWIDDAKLLLAVPPERSLKILGPGLAAERTISVPDAISKDFAAWPAGGSVLLADYDGKGSVWRLDLKTDNWKKIW